MALISRQKNRSYMSSIFTACRLASRPARTSPRITPAMISTPYHRMLIGPIWKITGLIRFSLPLFLFLKPDSQKKSHSNLTHYPILPVYNVDFAQIIGHHLSNGLIDFLVLQRYHGMLHHNVPCRLHRDHFDEVLGHQFGVNVIGKYGAE